jgi:cyclophilin family peptidyl-prolyl cis-trans isomerase
VVLCFTFFALAIPTVPSQGAGRIGATDVVVNNVYGDSLNRRMERGEGVQSGQKVRTGVDSATNIVFADETTLSVGERSELVLDDLVYDPNANGVGGVFNVVKGVLRFVSSAPADRDLTIKTKFVQIGLRGTSFDVYATSRATEIAVHEGQVQVDSRFASQTVDPGQVYRVSDARGAAFEAQPSADMVQAVSKMLALTAVGDGAAPASELAAAVAGKDAENLLYLDFVHGRLVVEMLPDLAPVHVARIKALVRQGFYDGLTFHNVVKGFVAETGDPTGTGAGGSGKMLKAEISDVPLRRGVVGMKHTLNAPDTADSQFFILLGPVPILYTGMRAKPRRGGTTWKPPPHRAARPGPSGTSGPDCIGRRHAPVRPPCGTSWRPWSRPCRRQGLVRT